MSFNKEDLRYQAILFFFLPVLGLLQGVRVGTIKSIRWSVFIFTVIFGSLLNTDYLGDGKKHWEAVYIHYQYLDFSVWWKELLAILSFAPKYTTNDDVFIHVISYIIGGIFNAPGLFFVVVAIVFGYFFSGSIERILKLINWKTNYNKFYFLFFLFFLILWKNPINMQTVRTWTGMWILVYAILSYHETKKFKYILLTFVPPLVHVAYFVMCIPFWLVLFSGLRRPKLYFIVFVLSIFFSNISEQSNLLSFAKQTELGKSKTEAYYMTDDKQQNMDEKLESSSNNFYKKYEEYRIHYQVLTGIIFFIFLILRNKGFGKIEDTLFSYSLAGASFANFFTSIFALHSRTWQVSGTFILILLVVFLSKNDLNKISFNFLKVKIPLSIFALALIPYLLFMVSALINYSSAYILCLPIAQWIAPEAFVSIKEIIVLFI